MKSIKNPQKYEQSISLMNTNIDIKLYTSLPKVDANNIINEAFNEFYKVVARFTRFSDSSEVGILNKSNGQFVEIAPDLFELIRFGLDLGKKTNGLFDITIIDILEAYGYDKDYSFEKLDDPNLIEKIENLVKNRPKLTEIELDEDNHRIKLKPNQRIDLGAYAKGYAIRLAKELFEHREIDNFLINAGGDIYAGGEDIESNIDGWDIKIFDPQKTAKTGNFEYLHSEVISNTAIACSGPWARKVKFFHHLINPYNGLPVKTANDLVFLKHPDSMVADAYATIKFLGFDLSKL